MTNYEVNLMQEFSSRGFQVFSKPYDHLNKSLEYSKREILLLAMIGIERVRRATGENHQGQTHTLYNSGVNSSNVLEKIFWRENPDGGIVFQDPASHLEEAGALPNKEIMALALIGIERVAVRNLGEKPNYEDQGNVRVSVSIGPTGDGRFEKIFCQENASGGHIFDSVSMALLEADDMNQRELLSFIMLGLERLNAQCGKFPPK
eukprot:gb/GECH01008264.1/.p1 GENE.gb/GECH01008264.1/~~gb/GECH01008264.1/.p1  ORF type:complete len:205 (+),score=41.42 gb/GECH01008264.1/:1-615(+)